MHYSGTACCNKYELSKSQTVPSRTSFIICLHYHDYSSNMHNKKQFLATLFAVLTLVDIFPLIAGIQNAEHSFFPMANYDIFSILVIQR